MSHDPMQGTDALPLAEPVASRAVRGRGALVALVVALLAFAVVALRCAWISDDAFITFRTVANWSQGHGLTWNPGERVQAYTHPLWLFLIALAQTLTGEMPITVTILSAALSVLAVSLFACAVARSLPAALVGVLALASSKAFVDYSTSGLENPLTHLLLASFVGLLLAGEVNPGRLRGLSFLAAAVALTRMDAILLVAPALGWAAARVRGKRALVAVVQGFVPFVLWEGFSLLYYGFLFPNTAYAKLQTGLPRSQLVAQGFLYLLDSLNVDPVTLVVIGAGLVVSLVAGDSRIRTAASGIALWLAYTVAIGGDFMSGRFLSAPLFVAVLLFACVPASVPGRALLPAALAVGLVGLGAPRTPWRSDAAYGQDSRSQKETVDRNGISDERAFYYPATGLLRAERGVPLPSPRQLWVIEASRAKENGPAVVVRDAVGFFGFYAGPGVHVVDQAGLGDAFLARLPPVWRYDWRIGHFFRVIPEGYVESLAARRNLIGDPRLAEYYAHLSPIIHGPLFSARRWAEIVRMNLGLHDHLVEDDRYRYPGMLRRTLADFLATDAAAGGSAVEPTVLPRTGMQIDLGAPAHAAAIEMRLDRDHDYRVVFLAGGSDLETVELWALPTHPEPMMTRVVLVPGAAAGRGYDALRILPCDGHGDPRLARVRLLE